MIKVFLSYARGDDEPFVRRLYDDLKAHGFDVWFDRVSMPSRQLTFFQEIRDAIAARDRLLLVIGPKAITSEYVTQEWKNAFEMGKCVNPIVRLNGQRDDGGTVDGYALIPNELALIHTEDFRDDARYAEHLANLTHQLSDPAPPLGKLVAVPIDHPQQHFLPLIEEALRRDIHFIALHSSEYPQALFQCLWNSCWWYDSPQAARHYQESAGPWSRPGPKLHELLDAWRTNREENDHDFYWVRSLRPPPTHLGTAQRAVLRGHEQGVMSVVLSADGRRISASVGCEKWGVSGGNRRSRRRSSNCLGAEGVPLQGGRSQY
jgi:TIR domain